MSSVVVTKVESKNDLKNFINFHYDLYKGNEYDVPNLFSDDMSTLSKDKNAAFEFCEAECFIARKDGRVVGRVAAIINHRANKKWNRQSVRFGWIDFIDDLEVSSALMKAVEEYGKSKGMTEVVGPLGFTDFDPEGMLTFGFDQLGTMATIYNYPYYPEHVEKWGGYEKDNDYVEFKIHVPDKVPDKMVKISELIKYVNMYFPMVDLNLIPIIEDWSTDEHKLVGVGITIPSLSKALQKCHRGRLLPFGWWHVIRALKFHKTKIVDLMMIGVLPEYRTKGVNALMFYDLIPWYNKYGIEWGESQVEMETNENVQSQWQYFDYELHKRRRCYVKKI